MSETRAHLTIPSHHKYLHDGMALAGVLPFFVLDKRHPLLRFSGINHPHFAAKESFFFPMGARHQHRSLSLARWKQGPLYIWNLGQAHAIVPIMVSFFLS
jgi:hypothetical protein